MPPQTQDLIYENPKTKERVKWDGQAWIKMPAAGVGPEARQAEQRPDAAAQAMAKLAEAKKVFDQHQESTFVPTHGYGGGGGYVTGKPEEIEGIKSKQRMVNEAGLAAAGGEIAAPLSGTGRVVSALTRAGGAGAGAGTGAAMSGADLKDAMETAGIFGATELGLHAVFSGGEAIYKLFTDPKLSMQQAGQMLAGAISKEDLSPAQFGKGIQEGFDAISRRAGAEKGDFIARVAKIGSASC